MCTYLCELIGLGGRRVSLGHGPKERFDQGCSFLGFRSSVSFPGSWAAAEAVGSFCQRGHPVGAPGRDPAARDPAKVQRHDVWEANLEGL